MTVLTGHKIESVAEKHFGSEYGASGYKRVTLPALINFVGEILAAHSAGAQAYPTVEHWLTEIAGEREIGHAIQEMTHMEVARQAWSAARAMTGSAGAQASDSGSDSIAFDYAHKLLSERLGVQSKYDPCDPGNWRDSDDAMGNAAQPQPSPMTDAARDGERAIEQAARMEALEEVKKALIHERSLYLSKWKREAITACIERVDDLRRTNTGGKE